MIEQMDSPKLLLPAPGTENHPALIVSARAYLDCGCEVWIGARWDSLEVATTAGPCSAEHLELVNRFNVLMFDSLEDPTDELLVDVCDRLLRQAQQEV